MRLPSELVRPLNASACACCPPRVRRRSLRRLLKRRLCARRHLRFCLLLHDGFLEGSHDKELFIVRLLRGVERFA